MQYSAHVEPSPASANGGGGGGCVRFDFNQYLERIVIYTIFMPEWNGMEIVNALE